MKRLLSAVGLAAVACLALVLAACTETTSLDEPLAEVQVVYGYVSYGETGEPVDHAKVIIWYYDDDEWKYAKLWTGGAYSAEVYTDQTGYYVVHYCNEAKGKSGKVTAEKTVGEILYVGETYFTYPNGVSTHQDVDVVDASGD